MKQLIKRYIFFLLFFPLALYANEPAPLAVDSLPADSVEEDAFAILPDSVLVEDEQEEISLYRQSELDERTLMWALSWLDTTDCVTREVAPVADSVYKQRLAALPCTIEMSYNSLVRAFINRYIDKCPRQVASLQQMSNYYFPIFEDALLRHGLPAELKYLPVIESALNPSAHSHAGAAGLWQFMPSTAKKYGLEVNSLVDERMDPIKSTEAACIFLKALYDLYGDWNLAIAAYNCGPGNVNKAIYRSGGKRDFWDIYPWLPRETRSYLPIFIAANYALTYAGEHGICPANLNVCLATDTIRTTHRLHLLQVASVTGISLQELRRLNPQYQRDILPGEKAYPLCLPINMAGAYIQLEDTILAYKADSLINNRRAEIDLAQKTASDGYATSGVIYYKIKSGDTLGGIAKKFHVKVSQIQKWNGLKGTNIRAGKTLKIRR